MDSDFSSDHDESENISSDHDESENISSDHGESENISVQDESEVSSLQMSCLCYISRHVQEFPVWHLASLPKRLRIDVLRFLPAVDICRLEEGPVSADIDMELEVWDTVCDIRLSYAPAQVLLQLSHLENAGVIELFSWEEDSQFKAQYFDIVTGCLFASNSTSKPAAYRLLCHVPEIQSSGSPPDTFSDVEMLHILMEQCHFFPPLVNITVGSLLSSTLWLNKTESFTVLAAFFSHLSRLSISAVPRWGEEDPESLVKFCEVFRFVLEAVFLKTNRQPALTHLVVELGEGVMISALDHLADFLSSRTCGLAKYACSPLVAGYSGLQFLSVDLSGDDESICSVSELPTNVRLIVEQQSDLSSLHLSVIGWTGGGYAVCPEYDQLMQSISMLFRGPQFVELELSGGLYHSSRDHTIPFKMLMHEFLSSPVKGQELVLGISGVSLSDCSSFHECSFANLALEVVGSKHLHIQSVEAAEQWVNPYFEHCLAHFPFQALGTVTLQEVDNLNDEALATIASLSLHTLHVISTELMLDVSVEAVARLFSMPRLTTLTLAGVAIMGTSKADFANPNVWTLFAEAVTIGLRKQASIAQLDNLDLSGNFLTWVDSDCLEAMFDALFSLPQLPSMALELVNNFFNIAQLNLLCESWDKKAGGCRLSMLRVRKQKPQQPRAGHFGTVPVGLQKLAVIVL